MFIVTLLTAKLLIATVTQCRTEDDMNCHWNAAQQGNGYGQSFIDIDGTTIRIYE